MTAIGDLRTAAYRSPGSGHWLGTDQCGRDVLSRTIYGARISLWIALLAASLAVGIGTVVGLTAGYAGGRADGLLMRGVDVLLAFPRLFLVLLLAGLLRPSAELVVVALGFTGWMPTARLVRAQAQALRGGGYVDAARALGFSTARILGAQVLPNVAAPVLVSVTLGMGQTLLAESALSFLGTEIAPSADPETRTFKAKLDLPPAKALMSGQFARLVVPLGETKSLRIPASALVQRGQLDIVFVAAEQRARMHLVKTGRRFGGEVEILSGLDERDSVVVEGAEQLADGQPLQLH